MANIKISELNGITKKANDDVLAIVDVSADETKKIAVGDLLDKNVELIAVSDIAPAECLYGDKYFNTIDNLIYTAIATDTWSEDGEEPISGILYIVYAEQASYSWSGTELISVGGGKEDIVIDDEEPTDNDWKIWIDNTETTDNTYYNDNGTATPFKATTFDTLPVGTEVDYDGSVVPDGWTEVDGYSAFEVTKDDTYVQNIVNSSYKYGKLVNLNLNIQPKNATMGTGGYKLASGAPAPLNGIEFFAGEYTSSGNVLQRLLINENGEIYWWYNNQFENTSGWRIAVNLVYLTTD